MATSLENHDNPTLAAQILNLRCIGPELCVILCNFAFDIQNFVVMATSLHNFGNIIEISYHRNPTLTEKIWKLRCTGPDLCSILCHFGDKM